jgi:HEAT repeats
MRTFTARPNSSTALPKPANSSLPHLTDASYTTERGSSTSIFRNAHPEPSAASGTDALRVPRTADRIGRRSWASSTVSSFGLAVYLAVRPVLEHASVGWPAAPTWVAEDSTPDIASDWLQVSATERDLMETLSCMPPDELEDGMTLRLGTSLAACLDQHGELCLTELAEFAMANRLNPDSISHALRWIGRISSPATLNSRLALLIRTLEAPSPTIRDGAALGLVELGSPVAVQALRSAIARERNLVLREDLEQAADYLTTKA